MMFIETKTHYHCGNSGMRESKIQNCVLNIEIIDCKINYYNL